MKFVLTLAVSCLLVFPSPPATAESGSSMDEAFRKGWDHFSGERFAEAREAFGAVDPADFDLGDYVLYFTGVALVREGKPAESAAVLERIADSFPSSPLLPYLAHELAFHAAREGNVATAARYFDLSRGKVAGGGRKASEGYIAARLAEERGGEDQGERDPGARGREAAEAHLSNFASYLVEEGAALSMERIWEWSRSGKLAEWGLPVSFYGRFAQALFRAGEAARARTVFREALEMVPPTDESGRVLLDYAEFLRKRRELPAAREVLAAAPDNASPAFRSEAGYLLARVEWMAGRPAEARRMFLEVAAEGGTHPGTAELARYQAAWISEEQEDLEAATEEFGNLRTARDEQIRRESVFRNAFGLYRQKRHPEAVSAFVAGKEGSSSPVERARHAYWLARALAESGEKEEGEAQMRILAGDPDAGPFAILAVLHLGGNPYAMLDAPSTGETFRHSQGREELWAAVRGASWSEEDAKTIRRVERLSGLGVIEYAVLEAERVGRAAIRKAMGIEDGEAPGLFRYLAGDLRGAIRETLAASAGRPPDGLVARLHFPLAPQYLGDCEGKKSGVDSLVLHAIIRQESLFQSNALSPAGAVGLMQLMPGTAAEVAREEKIGKTLRRSDLLKPELNVALGAAYFARLLRTYDGDYFRAVAAYNAGEAAVARWWKRAEGDPAMFLERISYRETRSYLRKVFFNLLQYYRIYRPEMLARFHPSVRTGDGTDPGGKPPPRAGGTPAAPEGEFPDGTEGSEGGKSGG